MSGRKLILLDDLPSTSKISKRLQQNAASEQYKGHFVNKYTLMYFEKERYKAEVDRLKSIIEEQKQTIGKLIVNSEIVLIDTETQTDTPIFDDVGIQTDLKQASSTETQTPTEWLEPSMEGAQLKSIQTQTPTEWLEPSLAASLDESNVAESDPPAVSTGTTAAGHSETQTPSDNLDEQIDRAALLDESNVTEIEPSAVSTGTTAAEHSETQTPSDNLDEPSSDELRLDQNTSASTMDTQHLNSSDVPIELSPSIIAIKAKGPPYICDCGYNCQRKIARVINHQREGSCPKNPRTAPLIPCPICSKEFTFSGLKSHFKPFTKPSSRSTYSRDHSQVNVENHKRILEEIKEKHAPKRLKLSVE